MKKGILLCLMAVMGFVSSADLVIGSGSSVYVGNARVYLYGGLRNPLIKDGEKEKLGSIDFHTSSRLHFVGIGNDVIENIYTLSNITVNKPSGNISIANSTNNFLLAGNAALGNGNLLTGSSIFELGSTATVTGESTGGYIVGRVRSARSVGTSSSAGTGHFGGIGFTINSTGSNLGTVTVNRHTGAGTQETIFGSQGIQRKWEVETSVAFSGTRNVTASWLSTNDNGNNLSNVKVWQQATSKSNSETEIGDMRRNISLARPAGITTANARFDELIDFGPDEEQGDEANIYQEPKTVGWMEVTGATFNTGTDPRTSSFTMNDATVYTINDIGNQFAGGAGTEGNPYQIETLDQLNNVRNYLTAHFIQIADIDASPTTTWNSGAGWVPIGTSFSDNFTGVYNGNGHTISGLFINRPSTNYQGLFGRTEGATIKNLGFTGSNITGAQWVGGIVGLTSSTLIENCYAEGQVKGNTEVGGIVGRNSSGSTIRNCYANGTVTRASGTSTNIAGFTGANWSTISNSYSTASVHYEGSTDPTNSGFTGSNSGTMTGNFWNTETSGQSSTAGTATGLTTFEMMSWENFLNVGWDFQGETTNGTEDIWGINPLANNGFPFLSWEGFTHNPYSGFAGGFGTEQYPYQIETLDQLNNVRNYLSAHFIQIANIDASPTSTWNSGAGWVPVRTSSPFFTGSYDGDNHKITDLHINRSANYQSLFGYTSGAMISNLHLIDVDITGAGYVSGLVGWMDNSSVIDRCSVKGYITGSSDFVAPIAAYVINNSIVSNSFANAQTRGLGYVAGLVGRVGAGSEAIDSYAMGSASRISGSSNFMGGIAGYNNDSKIIRCYSIVSIHHEDDDDPTDKGITHGANNGFVMEDNFWDIQTSGQTSSGGNATGRTTAEMKLATTFTNWDFATEPVWKIKETVTYPYFAWQPESTQIAFALNPTEGGSINAQSGNYPEGMPITLSATTNSGYNFLNWTSGATKNVMSADPVFEYVVTGQDITIIANFEAILLATVTTSDASAVMFTSATLGGNVTGDGGGTVSERGVVYSQSEDPEIDGPGVTKVQIGSGTGNFGQSVTELEQGTLYYFRAYAINDAGTSYGVNKFFNTSELSAPSNIVLTVVGSNVEMIWDPVSGATGYYVYSSEDPYGTFILDETGSFTGENWTSPMSANKMFYFLIAVYDAKVIPQRTINVSSGNLR